MPITENGEIKYSIPPHIRSFLTPTFSTQFLKELHMIFGVSLEDADMDYFVYQGGTSGWAIAFATACRKLGLEKLYSYYRSLPWYDSDAFDCDLSDVLVEQKLILGGFLYEEIARQNEMAKEDVVCCEKCGKYYHMRDVIKNKVDLEIEGDNEPYVEYICKSCSNNSTVKHLPFNANRTISEILNRNPSDFFVCEKCGKTHYLAHRGKEYCLYCEQVVEDGCSANNYYREMLKEQEKYRDELFGKISK